MYSLTYALINLRIVCVKCIMSVPARFFFNLVCVAYKKYFMARDLLSSMMATAMPDCAVFRGVSQALWCFADPVLVATQLPPISAHRYTKNYLTDYC